MGNGEWGMGNEKHWSAVIPKKIKLESAQYGKETKTARGKRKM